MATSTIMTATASKSSARVNPSVCLARPATIRFGLDLLARHAIGCYSPFAWGVLFTRPDYHIPTERQGAVSRLKLFQYPLYLYMFVRGLPLPSEPSNRLPERERRGQSATGDPFRSAMALRLTPAVALRADTNYEVFGLFGGSFVRRLCVRSTADADDRLPLSARHRARERRSCARPAGTAPTWTRHHRILEEAAA